MGSSENVSKNNVSNIERTRSEVLPLFPNTASGTAAV